MLKYVNQKSSLEIKNDKFIFRDGEHTLQFILNLSTVALLIDLIEAFVKGLEFFRQKVEFFSRGISRNELLIKEGSHNQYVLGIGLTSNVKDFFTDTTIRIFIREVKKELPRKAIAVVIPRFYLPGLLAFLKELQHRILEQSLSKKTENNKPVNSPKIDEKKENFDISQLDANFWKNIWGNQ